MRLKNPRLSDTRDTPGTGTLDAVSTVVRAFGASGLGAGMCGLLKIGAGLGFGVLLNFILNRASAGAAVSIRITRRLTGRNPVGAERALSLPVCPYTSGRHETNLLL